MTADIVVLRKRLGGYKVLLIKRKNHPCINGYALPGGFVEDGESAVMAAMRELHEETAIISADLVSVGLFSEPERDPRDWVVSECFATIVGSDTFTQAGDDALEAYWFDLNYTFANNKLELWLTHPKIGLLGASLNVNKVEVGNLTDYNLEITQNRGLAFDHAKMIGKAVLVCFCER